VRYAFLALLFCNLAYFAWAHWIDVPPPPPVNEAIAKLPALRLAAEVPLSERPLAQAPKPVPTACFSVGPFGDPDNSAHAAAILRAKGFDPKQRSEEGQMQDGYWVFVNVTDQTDIDRALVMLEHGGIKDAIVMPVTPEINGRRLSLGVYTQRARAVKRAQFVQQTGLKAEVGERKLPATQYWMDMAPLPGTSTVPIQDLFADGIASKIEVQPCPAAASAPPASPTSTPAGPVPATGTAGAASGASAHGSTTAGNAPSTAAEAPKLR
jgi:hypothetical protein